MEKSVFVVNQDGPVNGLYRKKGDEIQMTEREAKYLVPAGVVSRKKIERAASKPAPAVQGTKDEKKSS